MKKIELEIYETAKDEFPKEFDVRVMVKTSDSEFFHSSIYYRGKKFLSSRVTHWFYSPTVEEKLGIEKA